MSRRNRFTEGTVFVVPLRDRGCAVGVLARMSGEGHAFGYFFGPRIDCRASVDTGRLQPDEAVLVGKFGDLELLRGNWTEAGSIEPWEPSMWPMLPLARIDEGAGKAWLSTYDENFKCTREEEISIEDAARYPYDRLMGSGSVEIRLTKLLRDAEASQ